MKDNKKFAKGILYTVYLELRIALIKFKREALRKSNFRYFLYYAAANFIILTLYSLSLPSISLELKPVTSPAVEGSFLLFVAAVILLPLTLLLEELGFRLLPMFFIRDLFHLNKITTREENKERVIIWDDAGIYLDANGFQRKMLSKPLITKHHSRLRIWAYHHWIFVFVVVSALWAAMMHQINIVESSALGSLIYFGVQFFSGCCFAGIYAKRGLGAVWIVHTGWDYFLILLNLAIVFLG